MDITLIEGCNILNENNYDGLLKFLHACIDEICLLKGPSYQEFISSIQSKEEFNNINNYFISFFLNPVCLLLDEEKMPMGYHKLPSHVQQAVLTSLKIKRSQLAESLLFRHSLKHTSTLHEFNWRLKYIMGSSKMASVKEPLLQLDLNLNERSKGRTLELELNQQELSMLINNLETIKY